jgi:hypothetical protein
MWFSTTTVPIFYPCRFNILELNVSYPLETAKNHFNFIEINSLLMGKGNKSIDQSMVKKIFEGNILIPLPKVLVENRYHSMFSLISPTHCDFCGTKLNVNSHYTRSILTSYGTINCNITYWIFPDCEKHFHDEIVGVIVMNLDL